jgi:hypothetical protein
LEVKKIAPAVKNGDILSLKADLEKLTSEFLKNNSSRLTNCKQQATVLTPGMAIQQMEAHFLSFFCFAGLNDLYQVQIMTLAAVQRLAEQFNQHCKICNIYFLIFISF